MPLEGNSYYRITQYDYDGTSQSSELIVFRNYNSSKILHYEAKSNLIHVSNNGTSIKYQISNLGGQIVSSGILQENKYTISTEFIPNGIYFFSLIDQEISTSKIIIAGK